MYVCVVGEVREGCGACTVPAKLSALISVLVPGCCLLSVDTLQDSVFFLWFTYPGIFKAMPQLWPETHQRHRCTEYERRLVYQSNCDVCGVMKQIMWVWPHQADTSCWFNKRICGISMQTDDFRDWTIYYRPCSRQYPQHVYLKTKNVRFSRTILVPVEQMFVSKNWCLYFMPPHPQRHSRKLMFLC